MKKYMTERIRGFIKGIYEENQVPPPHTMMSIHSEKIVIDMIAEFLSSHVQWELEHTMDPCCI